MDEIEIVTLSVLEFPVYVNASPSTSVALRVTLLAVSSLVVSSGMVARTGKSLTILKVFGNEKTHDTSTVLIFYSNSEHYRMSDDGDN